MTGTPSTCESVVVDWSMVSHSFHFTIGGELGSKPCIPRDHLASILARMLAEDFYSKCLYKEEITHKQSYIS